MDTGLKESQNLGAFRAILFITKKTYIPLPTVYYCTLNPNTEVLASASRARLFALVVVPTQFPQLCCSSLPMLPTNFQFEVVISLLASPPCLLPSNFCSFRSFNHEDSHSVSHWRGCTDIDKGECFPTLCFHHYTVIGVQMCGVHGFCDAFVCIMKLIQVSTCAGIKSWQPSERPTGLKQRGV